MRIEHTNLTLVPCTLSGERNAPANGCTFVSPIGIDKPPAEMGLQFGRVQTIGQTISGQSVSIIAGQPNTRTSRALRVPQAIRGASTDRPYLPSPEARRQRLQTSYAFQSSSCAGKRDPRLRVIRAYTNQECECFAPLLITDKMTCPQSAIPETVLGNDETRAAEPALYTSKRAPRMASAKARCFSRRFASDRSR